jgi:hypothetical protein
LGSNLNLYHEIEQARQQLDLYICSAVFISMAPQPNFVKDVLDAFERIDDLAGRPRRPEKVFVVFNQEPAVITHLEAAKRFGGVAIKEHPIGKGNRGIVGLQK